MEESATRTGENQQQWRADAEQSGVRTDRRQKRRSAATEEKGESRQGRKSCRRGTQVQGESEFTRKKTAEECRCRRKRRYEKGKKEQQECRLKKQ